MTRETLLIPASGLLLFLGGAASANPWLKDEGAIEVISSTTTSKEQTGLAASLQSSSSMHIEYGADERATLVLDGSFQRFTSGTASGAYFDNAWAGARVALKRWDNSLLSTEWVAGISGIHDSGAPNAGLSLYGTAEARLMFGQGFEVWRRHAFAGAEAGWRWRPGGPSDEAVFDATIGISPWSSALLMLQSFSIVGTGSAYGAYRRYDLSKLQVSIAQSVTERLWFQLGVVDQIAGTSKGGIGAVVGIWWRM